MKKALAILLTFILTFSCFSILGITVLAETSLLEPGFDNWYYNAGSLNSKDENGDGVNDYVRITSTTKKSNVAVATAPFELIPENEYELSFYIRIPDGSNSFLVDGAFKAPEVIIYEPTVSADTGKATTVGTVSATQTSNNYYAYRYNNKTDTSLSWSRRLDFSAEWTVDGYEALTVTRYSNFAPSSQKTLFGETADVKEIYANWTKITAKFTALADEDGETSQTTAVCFNVKDIGKLDGYMLDIKDVTLVNKTAEATEPEEPDEPEPEPEPEAMDFEDATKWGLNGYKSTQLAGYEGHVTPEDYLNVTENTDPTYILDGDSSIKLSTNSRWYDYKLTDLKSNTKYALKFSYLAKDPKKPDSSIDKNILSMYGIFNYAASDANLTNKSVKNALGYLNYVNTTGYVILDDDGLGASDYYKNGVRAITVKEEGDVWYTATLYFNTSVVKDTLALVMYTNCNNVYLDKFQLVEVDYTNPAQDFNAPEISEKTKKGPFISENTTSYLYENCTSEDYEAYLATLENAEFVQYATNAYGDNKFATYTKGNTTVTVTYTPNNGTILVTDQATDTLPTTKEQNVYEDKGLQPLIIQLDHNNTTNGGIGMSYIIRLADGSYIIVDGGHTETKFDNAIRLYDLLRQYTPNGKIKIAAWLITHCHSDHIGGFISFVERYSNEADIEQVIYNSASYEQFKANADASDKATQKEPILPSYINQDAFTAAVELLRDSGTKISTCHSGYEYNIRNAVINVMFTLEDVFPKVFSVDYNDANNTSSVFKISFTDENIDQTLLITGDSSKFECEAMYNKYTGDELKSTFVQVIHHGISYGTYELYAKINPEVVLWPSGYSRIMSQLYQSQNQYFIAEETGVKEIVLSDYGTRVFALPYTAPEGLVGFERFTLPDDMASVNSLENYIGVSIRRADGDTKQALRFKFGIPEQVISSQTESGYKVVEYGAMVSESSTNLNYYSGNKAYVTENAVKTYKGVSYNKAENKNIVFDYTNYANLDDGVSRRTNYTSALNNIGVDKNGNTDYSKYDTTYYIRAYIVFENAEGDTKVYYGDIQSASVFAVMKAALESDNADDITYVKNFLDGKVEGFTADAAAIKKAWTSDETRASLYTPVN